MSQEQAQYTTVATCYETPREWVYTKYDEEKLKLWLDCEELEEYHERLAVLIDELGL